MAIVIRTNEHMKIQQTVHSIASSITVSNWNDLVVRWNAPNWVQQTDGYGFNIAGWTNDNFHRKTIQPQRHLISLSRPRMTNRAQKHSNYIEFCHFCTRTQTPMATNTRIMRLWHTIRLERECSANKTVASIVFVCARQTKCPLFCARSKWFYFCLNQNVMFYFQYRFFRYIFPQQKSYWRNKIGFWNE